MSADIGAPRRAALLPLPAGFPMLRRRIADTARADVVPIRPPLR
jgi:hypothetical protein